MLEAINLQKKFKTNKRKGVFSRGERIEVNAVNGIDINVKPGQIIGLLGVNGAGKTTTIKMLAGLIKPSGGSIYVDGVNGIKNPNEVKKIINMISGGERNIYWRLTAKENLEYFGSLYNLNKEEIKTYVEKALSLVGLSDVKNTPVEQYSKGMKQRLQIARGLINNPKYIYLDEPTLGLDVAIAKEIRKYILSLVKNENKGVLLTSHYITEVEEMCDYVYILDKGKVINYGTPSEITKIIQSETKVVISVPSLNENVFDILQNTALSYGANLIFEKNESEVLIIIKGIQNLAIPFVKILIENNLTILQLTVSEPSLEDALIHLTMEGEYIG